MWHLDGFSSPVITFQISQQKQRWKRRDVSHADKEFVSILSCETNQTPQYFIIEKKSPLSIAVSIADEHSKKEKAKSTPHKQPLLTETIQPSEIRTKFTEP